MVTQQIMIDKLTEVGNYISSKTSSLIAFASNQTPAKIISIILLLMVALVIIKLIEKPIKWAIVGLIGILIFSVITSL